MQKPRPPLVKIPNKPAHKNKVKIILEVKEIKYPINPADPNKEYTVSLNLDDGDQLLVQNMNEDDDAEETAELIKNLFPDFSYVKRKRKPKKD